jgi:hypothetical protein
MFESHGNTQMCVQIDNKWIFLYSRNILLPSFLASFGWFEFSSISRRPQHKFSPIFSC